MGVEPIREFGDDPSVLEEFDEVPIFLRVSIMVVEHASDDLQVAGAVCGGVSSVAPFIRANSIAVAKAPDRKSFAGILGIFQNWD